MPFIPWLLERKYITKAQARLIELSVLSVLAYAGGAIISGEMINIQALLIMFFTPFVASINKALRDANKDEHDK